MADRVTALECDLCGATAVKLYNGECYLCYADKEDPRRVGEMAPGDLYRRLWDFRRLIVDPNGRAE